MSEQQEQKIEAALNVLREARTPQGMEARLLEAVRQRKAERSSPQTFTSRSWVWSGAAVAVVALLVAVEVHRHRYEPAPSRRHVDAARPSAPAVARETKVELLPPESPVRVATKPTTRKAVQVRSEDSLAMQEMRAPSSPAPPMPLTQQERLLLRVVYKGDPVELAMLSPAIRAARHMDEKAEVQRFFEPTQAGNE